MSIRPGPSNSLTDVPGVKVGGASDSQARTGVSVVMPDAPGVAGVDVRGGGPGVRETELLDPSCLVERVDAIVLSGGSVYGLDAASAVAARLGAQGRGFQLIAREGVPPSPIVPAAILYDLANGGDKNWGEVPPYAALARVACESLGQDVALGSAGAGYGARAGALAGGLGSASAVYDDGATIVGALMAVNAFGSAVMPGGAGAFWAAPFEMGDEFGGRGWPGSVRAADLPPDTKLGAAAPVNTTIGVVATNAPLRPQDARRLAIMAQDGLARALRPVHGPTDGDVVFVLSTAEGDAPPLDPIALTRLGTVAADCVARAIARGVFLAGEGVGAASYSAVYGGG